MKHNFTHFSRLSSFKYIIGSSLVDDVFEQKKRLLLLLRNKLCSMKSWKRQWKQHLRDYFLPWCLVGTHTHTNFVLKCKEAKVALLLTLK